MTERVIAYIDGFNLYFGLRAKHWQRYYWLNLQELAMNLLKPYQVLVHTKYFTSRVRQPPDKVKRQNTYLEALDTLSDFTTYYGKYQLNPRTCRCCGYEELVPSEKMSDVNIATQLLIDAFRDSFDTAMVISADGDLCGPIRAVRSEFPSKRILVVFPPARRSVELNNVATASLTLGRANIEKSLFPEHVRKADEFLLVCPKEWR